METKIIPNRLSGEIGAVTSKSSAHRLLVCAGLCGGNTFVGIDDYSEDIDATISCLRGLGAQITKVNGGCEVVPIAAGNKKIENVTLDCKESGSTLRFLIPVAACLAKNAVFTGSGRLPERPLGDILQFLNYSTKNAAPGKSLPLEITGGLTEHSYSVSGSLSSQFISGLLFALPLKGGGEINVIPPFHSKSYVDLTIETLRLFGVSVIQNGLKLTVGGHYKSPGTVQSEGDWSNSSFFLAAGAIGKSVTVKNIPEHSAQSDKAIIGLLERFGAKIKANNGAFTVRPAKLTGLRADVSEFPDLFPVLALVGSFAEGETVLYNAERLRIKECDRIDAVCELINALGGKAAAGKDVLTIKGTAGLTGGEVNSHNDHRIAMTAAIAGSASIEPVIIRGSQAVNKSYPSFFSDFSKLGGIYVDRK
jgi:3-phosphoshikimate 1-carboxyvinyltransferase